jgi:hypothetical protein
MEKSKIITAQELQERVTAAIREIDSESPNLDKLRITGTLTGRMLKAVSLDTEIAKRMGRPYFERTVHYAGANEE